VKEVAQHRGRLLERNDQRAAVQTFVSQVQKSNDALPKIDMRCALSVDVERLGRARQLEHDTFKDRAEVRRRDGDTLRERERTEGIAREDGGEEVERGAAADRRDALAVVGRERGRGDVREGLVLLRDRAWRTRPELGRGRERVVGRGRGRILDGGVWAV